ncbi:hypothetical protein ACO0R3_003801 [Hanseniaspora guilliermondii]
MVLISMNTPRILKKKDATKPLVTQTEVTSVLICSAILAATFLGLFSGFNRYLARYEQASDIPKVFFQDRNLASNMGNKNGKWLYGKVLSVGDGDNFNFYHMPGGILGGWGLIRSEPQLKLNMIKNQAKKTSRSTQNNDNLLTSAWKLISGNSELKTTKKSNNKKHKKPKTTSPNNRQAKTIAWYNDLYNNWFTDKTTSSYFMSLPIYYVNNYKHKTISVRLCGIDAPERSHFGSKAQPFSDEAMNFLKHTLLNKKLYIKPLEIDRYGRCVARVLYRDNFLSKQKDISLEMLKLGLATTFESKGKIDFDGQEEIYKKAELESKKKKRGMWRLKKLESPAEFKRKLREAK